MGFAEIVELISTVGFPIGVTIYLLIRNDREIASCSQAINNNTVVLEKILTMLGDNK